MPRPLDMQDDPELLEAFDPDAPAAGPDKGDDRSQGELPDPPVEAHLKEQLLEPGGPLAGGDTVVTGELDTEDDA